MKTSLRNLILAICLTATQAGPNLAHAGKGSGGGNNDAAFALQRVAEANPGLSEEEILIMAFNESAGRIPKLVYRENSNAPDVEYAYFLPSNNERASYMIALPSQESEAGEYRRSKGPQERLHRFYASRSVFKNGPLLGNSAADTAFFGGSTSASLYQLPSHTGILFGVRDFRAPDVDLKLESSSIEFRQYNSDIVIYVVYPNRNGTCGTGPAPVHPLTPFCEIGYVWRETPAKTGTGAE